MCKYHINFEGSKEIALYLPDVYIDPMNPDDEILSDLWILKGLIAKYQPDTITQDSTIIRIIHKNISSTEFKEFPKKIMGANWFPTDNVTYKTNMKHVLSSYYNVFLFDIKYNLILCRSGTRENLGLTPKFILTRENLHLLFINGIWGQIDFMDLQHRVLETLMNYQDYQLFLDMFLLLENVTINRKARGYEFCHGKTGYYFWLSSNHYGIFPFIKNTPEYHNKVIAFSVTRDEGCHKKFDNLGFVENVEKLFPGDIYIATSNFNPGQGGAAASNE